MGKIVVTTPTGNIGHVVVDRLVEAGADVAVIVRDPAKLKPAVRERVTVFPGDQFDTELVRAATKEATAFFWLTPPNYRAEDWGAFIQNGGRVAADAVRTNGIPYVVHLSSAGADRPQGMGPVSHLHFNEKVLRETGANVLQLRPGFFYENFLVQLDAIKNVGSLFYPIPPEISYPLIATHDIGVVAAQKLLAQDWAGEQILGLHGPVPQPTFGEAAQILGDAIGKPLQYVQVPLEAAKQSLVQMGASASVVELYPELFEALSRNEQPAEPRTAETTTPTTLYDWAVAVLRPLI